MSQPGETNVCLAQLQMDFAGPQIYIQPAKTDSWSVFLGFVEIFGLKLKELRMKTKCVSKFFASSEFTSDNQCPNSIFHATTKQKCTVNAMVS